MVHTLSRKILQFIPFCGPRFLLPGFVTSIDVYPTICFKYARDHPHRSKTPTIAERPPPERPKGAPKAPPEQPRPFHRGPNRPQEGPSVPNRGPARTGTALNAIRPNSANAKHVEQRGTLPGTLLILKVFLGKLGTLSDGTLWNALERSQERPSKCGSRLSFASIFNVAAWRLTPTLL
mgnify:CR=1 FL=1